MLLLNTMYYVIIIIETLVFTPEITANLKVISATTRVILATNKLVSATEKVI